MSDSDAPIPPDDLFFFGRPESYRAIGEEFLRYFIRLCDLKPQSRVLDVGCGIGRMAVPLTTYLDDQGQYEGFDVVPEAIAWCANNISTLNPNFRFQLADIHNSKYNPEGSQMASDYAFPFPDRHFDFVFLTSIFTHMLPPDVEHYLGEISRVLVRDGRCLITFFLLNEESRGLLASGQSTIPFPYGSGPYRLKRQDIPEAVVSYDERYVLDLFAGTGLEICRPIHYGRWCGRKEYLDFQDIIIARKG